MKKFLLLLVGVLFALSAKADYYLVGDMNGWKTNETYKFEAVGDGTYKLVVPGTIEAGQTYKICAGMNGESINWTVNIGAWANNYQLSYNSSYDARNHNESSNFQWKETATNPIIYLSKFFTDSESNNKVTITVYKNEESSVYISGDFNNGGTWVKPGENNYFKFTYTGGGVYTLDLSGKYSLTGSKEFKIYKDTNGWNDGTQYGNTNNSPLVVGTPYKATISGANIVVTTDVTNPVITFDAITQYITITEKSPTPTTYYYRLHGQIFEEGTDWKTQPVMTNNGDGTYSFEASLYAGSFGIKELPSEDATINDDNTWIRAAQGTGTISAANTPYKVAYKNSANDSGNDLSSELTGDYTIVFDKNNMTVTFVPKAQDYSGKTIAITGNFYNPTWPRPVTDSAKKFTFVSGSTYTLDLSGYTFDKNTEFKIRDVTGVTDESKWGTGYGPTNENSENKIEPGVEYTLTRTDLSRDLYVTTEIKDPQLTLDVATWTLTITPKPVTPTTYSYRFHSNMVNGTWPADDNNDPAWAMTKQSDGTWMWQGTLAASGAFGFKRLSEGEAPSKNNTWIYGKENNESKYNITVLDQWYDAKEKANFTDDSGHDWTFSPNGGTYQVIFDPANNRTKIVAVGGIDYKGRTYVISGTFNGWIAPADNTANCKFVYQETGDYAGKYVWSYTGLMKNLEFKISDLSKIEEDSDKKWGKAYGTTYTGSTRDQLTAGTETPYQLRRTNVPGEDVQVKDTELYNPTFILDPATMTLTVINNPVTAQYKYGVHSNFANPTDPNKWSCVEMDEHADGSWSYTVAIPNGCRFGIRQAEKGKDITVESNQTIWVSSSEPTNTTVNDKACVTALVATNHGTKKNGSNWATDNDAFNGTTVYTIVFTPAKDGEGNLLTDGTGTLVIYNNTAVNATIRPAKDGEDYLIVDGQKANEIVVTVPVANYLGTSEGKFSLSMGDNTIATADAVDGNVTFEYLPYLSGTREFTLSGASKSVALNVVSPSLGTDYFSLPNGYSITLIDNLTGYADAAVALEPTATLIYDIPVWYYTINGYTYEAEDVYWSTNGFSFIIKNMVAFDTDSYKAKEGATADCYGTPIFPFVVRKKASTFAVDASNLTIQQFGGSKVSVQVTVNADAQVSGVEGVAVENEEAPVEYYNLQGQRVNGELAPGIYIRRQGTTVTKVRI